MESRSAYIVLYLLLLLPYVSLAQAADSTVQLKPQNKTAGWMPAEGANKFIPYYSYYSARAYRDLKGRYAQYARNGRFVSQGLRLYNEYGLQEGLALINTVPLIYNYYQEDTLVQKQINLSDVEAGLRGYIRSFDTSYHLMWQLTALFPFYSNNRNPATGLGKLGAEAKLIFGGSVKRYYYKPFVKAELAFRQFVNGPPQLLYQLLGGYNLSGKDQLNLEISGTASYGSSRLFDQGNVAINQRYAFHKFTLNYGRQISSRLSFYAGLFHDFSNWNTGIGKGGQVFLVYKTE